jgi:hypothetical protein
VVPELPPCPSLPPGGAGLTPPEPPAPLPEIGLPLIKKPALASTLPLTLTDGVLYLTPLVTVWVASWVLVLNALP